MTTAQEHSRSTSEPVGRIALGVLLGISVLGTAWRLYQLSFRIRPELRAEFAFVYLTYPFVLILLCLTAFVLLNRKPSIGQLLAAATFGYVSVQVGWLAWSGGGVGYATELERSVGRLAQFGLAIGFSLLGAWLVTTALRGRGHTPSPRDRR